MPKSFSIPDILSFLFFSHSASHDEDVETRAVFFETNTVCQSTRIKFEIGDFFNRLGLAGCSDVQLSG